MQSTVVEDLTPDTPGDPFPYSNQFFVDDNTLLDDNFLTVGSEARQGINQANGYGDNANFRSPQFDPNALLNPRATAKRPQDTFHQNDLNDFTPNLGMGSMIERMHNVSTREEQPKKKLKANIDESDNRFIKSTFEGHAQNGIIGEHLKELREQGRKENGKSHVVDLTAGDETDDDVIITYDRSDQEICLGRLEKAFVQAFLIPTPKLGSSLGNHAMWPPLKVELRRRVSTDSVITVIDPAGKPFGKLDVRTSMALSPMMDAVKTNKIRLQARLIAHKKKPGESPGQSCSKLLEVIIVIYSPRKMAPGIGKFLSQKQLWLREPANPDRGVEYINPQQEHLVMVQKTVTRGAASNSSGGQLQNTFVTRTAEEVRSDVINMFDSLTPTEDLPEMEQDSRVITPLLKHQKQGLYFMVDREKDYSIEENGSDKNSLWRVKFAVNGQRVYYNVITGNEFRTKPPPVLGGILADMMGLGKTLSILSLITSTMDAAAHWATLSPQQFPDRPPLLLNSKATLLVAPVSTMTNWEEQIRTHLQPNSVKAYIYHGSNRKQDVKELATYDIVITTYSTIAADSDNKRFRVRPIDQTNWFRIVLDEGHMIRTQSSRQSQTVCALSAQRRWAVTGTPVQNRLDDLGALIKFLRIKPFDEKGAFQQFIMAPFKNADPEILPKLRLLVDSITIRRLKDRIDLPPRHDIIIKLEFSEEERLLYEWFARDSAQKVRAVTQQRKDQKSLGGKTYVHILRAILRLRLLCAHGQELLSDEDMKMTEGLSASSAIDLGDDEDEEKPALTPKQAYDMLHLLKESENDECSMCRTRLFQKETDDIPEPRSDNIIGHMTPCYQIVCPSCIEDFLAMMSVRASPDNYMTCPLCEQYVKCSLFELTFDKLEEEEATRNRIRDNPKLARQLNRYSGPHTKTKALLNSLLTDQQWSLNHPEEPPIKSVVFSGWTTHLDLVALALEDNHLKYTRLDGRMSRQARSESMKVFREDPAICIILISISAGGLGLNLTTANKAYVMEPQFNPAAEAQAVDRVHRLGQKREVYVTRFIMDRSFEEKMLELQKKKRDLADLSMNRNVKLDKEEAARQKMEELKSLFR
ncbi:hypothetical protein M501DRAFT_938002 [Patellaria atrata CBS 101060]|uniref:SNF2 family DNA-dependent ATPase domain-containing protein n=1 Tax=Patellaria atrata CBS 101060 TaxID=1346257 RepID=A0A9P4S7E9_9PEZI|nr:hypothetical protein M501DRAFT_938002 [Patellaria atrata CBS 101060]